MSFIGPMLSSSQGAGFQAQDGNLINVNQNGDQANNLYNQSQQGIGQQQAFLQALQGQNGISNQSDVFAQQQGLANQLQDASNGVGPNPAQAQLAQNTAANSATQAALMAGQRGGGTNPALMAELAARQGATNQQQAAGQAATLQAQQQIAARGQLQQQQAGMAGLATQQVGQQQGALNSSNQNIQNEQNNVLNSIAAQNNAQVGITSSQNSANSSIANTNAKGQQGIVSGIFGGIGSAFGLAEGGEVPGGQHLDQGGVPTQSPGFKQGPKSQLGQFLSGANQNSQSGDPMQAAGTTMGKVLGTGIKSLYTPSTGVSGSAGYMPDGSYNDSSELPGTQADASSGVTGESGIPDMSPEEDLSGIGTAMAADGGPVQNIEKLAPMLAMFAARGGKVPAMVSPGERYLSPEAVKAVEKGADPIRAGKKVPGKPKVKGAKNSYANDTVPATLEEGGIVLPRSVTESKNPHWAAHKFVSDIMAKNGKRLPPKGK